MKTLGQMLSTREKQALKVAKLGESLKLEKQRLATQDLNILNRMRDDDLDKAASSNMVYGRAMREEYRVDSGPESWEALYKYIRRYNMFELLHRRLSSTVAKTFIEEGKRIPGVKLAQWEELSVRKR